VQRHGGLSGARAALDHHHAGRAQADHLVLGGLDGGHDVAHAIGAGGVHRGEQRGVRSVRFSVCVTGERLVVEFHQGAAAGAEMPPSGNAFRVRSRCGIEGPRNGRPPVGEQRAGLVMLIGQPDPADVQRTVPVGVDPAEAQPTVRHSQAAAGDPPRCPPWRHATSGPPGPSRCRTVPRSAPWTPTSARRPAACRGGPHRPARRVIHIHSESWTRIPHICYNEGRFCNSFLWCYSLIE